MISANKPNSFSFVTEPDPTRFLVDLPIRPTTPVLEEEGNGSETPASTLTNPTPSNSSLTSTLASMSPTRASGASPDGTLRYGTDTTASDFTPSSPPNSSLSPSMQTTSSPAPRSQRSASKSKNRLSVTLTGLLGKGRARSASKDGPDSRSVSIATSVTTGEINGRSSASSSRRASIEDSSHPDSPSPPSSSTSPPLNGVTRDSSSPRSNPPVSLPLEFRRMPSASSITSPTNAHDPTSISVDNAARRSFDATRLTTTGLGLSSSSLGSSDGGLRSDGSTAATSPDLEPGEVSNARFAGVSSAEKRRRSSVVLAQELDTQHRNEEDLTEFVRASGSTSPSPHLSSPFARRISTSSAFPASAKVTSEPSEPSSSRPVVPPNAPSESTDSTIAARRQTRNIENLNLGGLGRRSPVSPGPALAEQGTGGTVTNPAPLPSLVPISPATRPRSTTQARLQALPRLLSTNAIPSYATAREEEEEQEHDDETESETEDGEVETEGETTAEATSEDEGDRYASADEAPTVSRSTTPAQTPRPASRQTSFDRFATSSSTSSPGPPRIPSLTGLSTHSTTSPNLFGARPSSSWVTFAPSTPGTLKTARPQPSSLETSSQSYFDLPRPSGSASKTPAVPPQTPLAPMSISDVARGKRPALQEEIDEAQTAHARTASTPGFSNAPPTEESTVRHGLYRLKSQSEVALMSPSMVDSDDEPVGTAAMTGLDSVWRTGGAHTPGPSFLSKPAPPPGAKSPQRVLPPIDIPRTPGPPPTPGAAITPSSPVASSPLQARLHGRNSTGGARLHRPRSMYELRDAPPAYTSIARQPGFGPRQDVQPREEEGKEGLPQYTCSIHIEGFMPRKMEFTAPGVQAKDRAWKRQYIVLHGTSIKVYKYDLKTHPIPGEEDWSIVPVDIAGSDGPPPLHFHEGEYGVDHSSHASRFPHSIEDAKAKAKSRIIQQATASSTNVLLRHYSLQNAESGLAADYIKRKHVVRVRAEGEQFLLQAKDDRGVIDLIEALQAATNVALDLDARPLPKFITLPRRRRRRRPRPDAVVTAGSTNSTSGTTSTSAQSAASAAPSPPPERPTGSPDRFAEMADEDRALATGNDATVM